MRVVWCGVEDGAVWHGKMLLLTYNPTWNIGTQGWGMNIHSLGLLFQQLCSVRGAHSTLDEGLHDYESCWHGNKLPSKTDCQRSVGITCAGAIHTIPGVEVPSQR